MGVPGAAHDGVALLAGRYRLLGLIGRGGMASVYQARDELLGRLVAVKLFSPGSIDQDFRIRQETEMRLLAGFDHPGLVRLYDAGADTQDPLSPRAFLVMELVPGRDLRARIAEGTLTPADTVRIGAALAGALIQVHARGIIHRDIKPANILLKDQWTENGGVKLADFGVARIMEGHALTATGMTIGTANYLSPEQARGLRLSPASDIYSLGLVLLECLTGRIEYPGTPIESAAARIHRAPAIPAGLTAQFRELLSAMTDLNPELRPNAATVEQALLGLPDQPEMTAFTAILPPLPARPPFTAATAKMTTVPAARGTAKGVGRHRRIALILALAAGAAIAAPLVSAAVQGSFSDRTTQTPAPTGGTPAPTQTVVVPGPVQTVDVPAPTQDKGKSSDIPGKDEGKGKGDED